MRATPSGQRKKQLQKTANSEYEPFRQDFEWIVENLRAERFRLSHPATTAAPHEAYTAIELDGPIESISTKLPERIGGSYSVLQHGLVNELLERRNRLDGDWTEAVRLLAPLSRKGWVLLGVLVGLVLLLATVAQLRSNEATSKGKLLLQQEFWWGGVVAAADGGGGTLVAASGEEGGKTCKTTAVGPAGTVVDSLGMQCNARDVSESGCCFSGWHPQASGTSHCATCRSSGCCQTMNDCVQCCLVPDHLTLLKFQFFALSRNGFPGVDFREYEAFGLCTALCRTSARSIDKHGKFVDEQFRFCYLMADARANV